MKNAYMHELIVQMNHLPQTDGIATRCQICNFFLPECKFPGSKCCEFSSNFKTFFAAALIVCWVSSGLSAL